MGFFVRWFLFAASVATLGACGGGSGSGDGSPQPDATTADMNSAWRSYLSGDRTIVVSGRAFNWNTLVESDLFVLTYQYSAPESVAFPLSGQMARRMTRQLSVTAASSGSAVVDGGTLETYFDDNFRLVGHRYTLGSSNPTCYAVTSTSPLPAVASINSSGAIAATQMYFPCGIPLSPYPATGSESWTYRFEAGVKFACFDSRDINSSGEVTGRTEYCHALQADGTLGTKARVTSYGSASPAIFEN
jgi:hypothetical protein